MKVLVTGAGGFLGRAVLAATCGAGHEVLALVRPAGAAPDFSGGARVTIVRGDLRERGDWIAALAEVDAVIHCAAAPSGDLPTQFAGTVVATENLLDAWPLANPPRIVLVSSFSVYDYGRRSGPLLSEDTAFEREVRERDAYTTTKIVQERLVRARCEAIDAPFVVVRPGMIYGPGKDWDFGAAARVGRFDLVFAPGARMPLTHVDNCADALVAALDPAVASGTTVNVVDDECPSHARYHRLCRRAGLTARRALPVPWFTVRALGWAAALASRIGFDGRAKLPELLALRRQEPRWRPLRYANARARASLGWSPRVNLAQGIAGMARFAPPR